VNDIPTTPVNPGFSSSHETHRLIETPRGLALEPTRRGPLHFALVAYAAAVPAWLLTKDLHIELGIKVAAWLFPVFAGTGPLIMYFVMAGLGARISFDTTAREVRKGRRDDSPRRGRGGAALLRGPGGHSGTGFLGQV
jgi:hypothetical protein